MTKAIHVCPQDPKAIFGGMGVAVLNLARAQAAAGWEVVWLALATCRCCEREPVLVPGERFQVLRIPVKDSPSIEMYTDGAEAQQWERREEFCRNAVAQIRKRYAADSHVFLHGLYFEPLLAAALANYPSISTYYLLETHGLQTLGEAETPFFPLMELVEVLSLVASRRVWAISAGMRHKMAQRVKRLTSPAFRASLRREARRWGVVLPPTAKQSEAQFAAKVRVIPLGISDDFYGPPTSSPIPGRVVAWGRVAPEKGFEHLLSIAPQFRSLTFALWGKLPLRRPRRQAYFQRLEALAAASPNVNMDFREWVPTADILPKLDAAEVAVLPSVYEPFGLVVAEALARGKPVIATNTDGPRDIFRSSRLGRHDIGYLVSRDPAKMTQGIAGALRDFYSLTATERHEMNEAARRRGRDFSTARMLLSIADWVNAPLP